MSGDHITVKIKHNDDLRRFSVPAQVSFDEFCNQITSSFRISNPFSFKYVDDEGDLINVATTTELHEAFRLSKTLTPPILRVTVFDYYVVKEVSKPINAVNVESRPAPQPRAIVVNVDFTSKQSEKEYPPLPVEEWTPSKKVVKIDFSAEQSACVAVHIPEPPKAVKIPNTISEHACYESELIASEISKTVGEISGTVTKFAAELMTQLKQTDTTFCAELSDGIRASCSDLAVNTAQMCRELSQAQSAESTRLGAHNKENGDLSVAISQACQKLSQETSTLCHDLAQTTTLLLQFANQQLEQGIASQTILKECTDLSSSTAALSQKSSEEIRRVICEM